jgi:phosphoglycolate phosphatase-like HAD superfamily hydrolase
VGGLTLALFDIDGTLIRGAGEGRRAMVQAATELFGRSDMFDHLSFAGAVDDQIVYRALKSVGISPTPRRIGLLRALYVRRLKRGFQEVRGSLCPGASAAVSAMAERGEIGIVTGNWRKSAWVKLEAYGLSGQFSGCVGAFGGDAFFRDDLLPIAVHRARRKWGDISRVLMIGDTPADISCARAGSEIMGQHGPEVVAVAVETGFASPASLSAAEPDLQVADLETGLAALLGVC